MNGADPNWIYVASAYAITALVFAGLAVHAIVRLRREARAERQAQTGENT